MAPRMTSPAAIEVHQAVHGYSGGHSRLASSIEIKSRDQKNMLVMSDASGPSANILDDGYFTGYPLAESGMYVIAKTWSATEMDRPGCVWTHSLLVDFSDLARLSDVRWLTAAFKRPSTNTLSSKEFRQPLAMVPPDESSSDQAFDEIQKSAAMQILWALYSEPNSRVTASAAIPSSLVFRIWAQQWPRLRRTFRFCTLSFADRSTDLAPFDLQLIPPDRSTRSRFVKTTDAEKLAIDLTAEWLQYATADIESPNTKFRSFFRDFGSDVTDGRANFVPLCQLYQLLSDFDDPARSVDQAVSFAQDLFQDANGIGVRTLIVTSAATNARKISMHSLLFAISNLDLLKSSSNSQNASQLVQELWNRAPEALFERSKENSTVYELATDLFKRLSLHELGAQLERIPDAIPMLLEARPDVVSTANFWRATNQFQDKAFDIAQELNVVQASLGAMFTAERADLASSISTAFGPKEVLRALDTQIAMNSSATDSETFSSWLFESIGDRSALADVFNLGVICQRKMLYEIAVRTRPGDLETTQSDPWMTAVSSANQGDIPLWQSRYLYSYIFARALESTTSSGELMSFSLDSLYVALANSDLAEDAWILVERRLPEPAWWWRWDRCRRLRESIADLSLDGRIQPIELLTITDSDALFVALVETIWWRKHGRRFVTEAKLAARSDRGGPLAKRAQLLEQFH